MSKKIIAMDIEIYPNYFMVGFRPLEGIVRQYRTALSPQATLSDSDRAKIYNILTKEDYQIITFNGVKFDMPMIAYALSGATVERMAIMTQKIIKDNLPQFMTINMLSAGQPHIKTGIQNLIDKVNHIDLIDITDGIAISLKMYGARIHSKTIEDLPYRFDTHLTAEEAQHIDVYNINDLELTLDLYKFDIPQIKMREELGKRYDLDLSCKAGAKIAEMIVSQELEKQGVKIKALNDSTIPSRGEILYKAPPHIKFKSPQLQEILKKLTTIPIKLIKGVVKKPPYLNDGIVIGESIMDMGLGGLHYRLNGLAVVPELDEYIDQADVVSYYPSQIINYKFYPAKMGTTYLELYTELYTTRQEWKAYENILKKHGIDASFSNALNSGYKLILNSNFGGLGQPYFKNYAPDLMIQITITGQLNMLMLIESLEMEGIRVFSSNTDSITYIAKKNQKEMIDQKLREWEKLTQMELESDFMNCFFARDINSYVYDTKNYCNGIAYYASKQRINKNIEYPIVYKAIRELIRNNVPIKETIEASSDIKEFISTRKAGSGSTYKGNYLGKTLRWYYGFENEAIYSIVTQKRLYDYEAKLVEYDLKLDYYNEKIENWKKAIETWKTTDWETKELKIENRPRKPAPVRVPTRPNVTKISKSDYAVPCLKLPSEIPTDLNRSYYVDLAYKHLGEIGWTQELQDKLTKYKAYNNA